MPKGGHAPNAREPDARAIRPKERYRGPNLGVPVRQGRLGSSCGFGIHRSSLSNSLEKLRGASTRSERIGHPCTARHGPARGAVFLTTRAFQQASPHFSIPKRPIRAVVRSCSSEGWPGLFFDSEATHVNPVILRFHVPSAPPAMHRKPLWLQAMKPSGNRLTTSIHGARGI
ncbi:hypothetical protein N656DRAFT_510473 [Canariomyces notabilis]|uniref:Uncharacterized protein n=1 Tax=Canariomyces notabilis TaxID=2074819 RepID=A0AAN6T6Z6_9PEZI|nr:hypothetical protein N656DRAFT_510473 [Canariomyces arenarius]